MSQYARMMESARRTRRTLYLITALYIVIGFVLATTCALRGDRLGAFFGFLIISGALAMSVLARGAFQLLIRISRIEEGLDDFASRIDALIHGPPPGSDANADEANLVSREVVNIPSPAAQNMACLAAATLDRDRYPRLVTAKQGKGLHPPWLEHHSGSDPNGQADDPLVARWNAALSAGDLLAARALMAQMTQQWSPDSLRPYHRQLRQLANRTERALRDEFTAHVRNRDFDAALRVGERICTLLGHRPVAAEFLRLRPLLLRRAGEVVGAV